MGAAWCRDRIEQAQNSKSPIDRLITRCSNAINAKNNYSKPNQSKPANDIVFKQIRFPTAPIVPVHQIPQPRSQSKLSGGWTDVPLHAVADKTPIPPPRRRKKRKVNSLEVLNSQLDKIYETRSESLSAQKKLFFGDPLPYEDMSHSSSSPERRSPTKTYDDDRKRKSRAKKIMETKTKTRRRSPPRLSLARDVETTPGEMRGDWVPPKMVKNISSVSLPSYNEMKAKEDHVEVKKVEREKRNVSTVSLPGESVLTAISGITINRLEAYMKRCKSFGSLKPQQLLEKLEEFQNKQDTESSDSWSGLDEWDLGIIEYDEDVSDTPMAPKCRLSSRHGRRVVDNKPVVNQEEEYEMPPTPLPIPRDTFQLTDRTAKYSKTPAFVKKPEMSALTSPKLLRELSLSDTNIASLEPPQELYSLRPVPTGSPPPKAQRSRKSFDSNSLTRPPQFIKVSLAPPVDDLEHSKSDNTLNKGPKSSCDSSSIPEDISSVSRRRSRLISERDGVSLVEPETQSTKMQKISLRENSSDENSLFQSSDSMHEESTLERGISQSDNTLDSSDKPESQWSSVPNISALPSRTPPFAPIIIIEDEDTDSFPVSNMFRVLSSYSIASDMGPTPPRRRSRDDLRRQSYHGVMKPRMFLPRSMSLDPTNEDMQPNLCSNWHDISNSSSRHSLTQALNTFMGYGSEKSSVSGRRSPSPPPLPTSPPPKFTEHLSAS